jgi:predicted nucleic acid-binding Zn ribbon protein
MPRRAQPRPFAPAVERMADSLMPATLIAEVQRAWPEAAGPALAAAGEPVSERDGIVTVACGSGVWAQELDLLSEPVVEALNERLGRPAVRRLRAVATPAPR